MFSHTMLDQNKQLNKLDETQNKAANFGVSSVSIFKDNAKSFYLYKKTEKLVSALYLLSGFISDREPIKWLIRESAGSLLSVSLSLSDRTVAKQVLIHFDFVSTGLKLLSFLEVSYSAGIISEMNFNILKQELGGLLQVVESEEKNSDSKGVIFPEHFFAVSELPQGLPGLIDKGQNIMSDRLSFKKPAETVRTGDTKQKDKTNRQEIILSLLKKNPELGIKDFTSSIKDCSEKTIQRELATLVYKGQIKKEGEKRWSRYSLK